MRRRLLLLVPLVLVALVIVAWWAVSEDDDAASTLEEPTVALREVAEHTEPRRKRERVERIRTTAPTAESADAEVAEQPLASHLPTWTVRVVDGAGLPVKGVRVSAPDARELTDADGRARLRGEKLTEPGFTVELSDFDDVEVTITEPETTVLVEDPLPLSVGLFDGATGRQLDARGRVSLKGVGVLENDPGHGLRAFLSRSPAGRGGSAWFTFTVDPPPGYALDFTNGTWSYGSVSALASAASADLVVRPEVKVPLEIRHHDGSPAVGAWVHRVLGANSERDVGPTERADALGRMVVGDLPLLPGVPIRLEVRSDERYAVTEWMRLDSLPTEAVTIVLPEEPNEPIEGSYSGYGMGGSSSGRFRSREGDVTVIVEVVRRSGTAARGVRVTAHGRSQVTDAAGLAVFEKVGGSNISLSASEIGFLPTSTSAALPESGTTRVRLVESEGRPVRIVVVSEEGLPLPFAEVEVEIGYRTFVRVDDQGVQHLLSYTDERGVLELPHAPPGNFRIEVDYGGRNQHFPVKKDQNEVRVQLSLGP